MIYTTLQILLTIWALFLAFWVTPADNIRSILTFRMVPGILGIGMAFFLIARYMGWPV